MSYIKKLAINLKKAGKDPVKTKESFTTLHNIEARRQEHDALKREQGFPEEQDPNAMRYQRYSESETDEQGKIMHNKPPWVVNEASEMIAEINDEDAPTYKKSDKARNRAGKDTASVTKALFNSEGQNYGGVIAPQRYEIVEKGLGDVVGKIKDKITGGSKESDSSFWDQPMVQNVERAMNRYDMHSQAQPSKHLIEYFKNPEQYHQTYIGAKKNEDGTWDMSHALSRKPPIELPPLERPRRMTKAHEPGHGDRETFVNPNTGAKAAPLKATKDRIRRSPEMAAKRAAQHGGLESDWAEGTEQYKMEKQDAPPETITQIIDGEPVQVRNPKWIAWRQSQEGGHPESMVGQRPPDMGGRWGRSGEGKKQTWIKSYIKTLLKAVSPDEKKEAKARGITPATAAARLETGGGGQYGSGQSIYDEKEKLPEAGTKHMWEQHRETDLPPEDLSDVRDPKTGKWKSKRIENFLPSLAGLAAGAAAGGDDDVQMSEKASMGSGGHARQQQRQFNQMTSAQKKRYGSMGMMPGMSNGGKKAKDKRKK